MDEQRTIFPGCVIVPKDQLIEHDDYGVHGSDFYRCKLCGGESGAGVLNKGIKHDPGCAADAPAADGWRLLDSCPNHVEVLFYRPDCGVVSGMKTDADFFMSDKDRESGQFSEEEQFAIDCWCYGPDGVERMDGDLVPTRWMPMPEGPQ